GGRPARGGRVGPRPAQRARCDRRRARRRKRGPRRVSATAPLAGRRIVVSAGPTYEDIDPVRYIGNRSSGKMGFAIAEAAARAGADVALVAGPVHLETP